ncbi:MAG: tripartite tricarboxylate transporter substrate binding protein [Betaproteobacteria bacterium]|nr:tripartite tricarboxylate transporter substrate binding protein [Betaproteobacteria bacterium]
MFYKFILRGSGAASIAILCGIASAHAQNFPAKPVTVIVPFPPGASADTTMRMVGQKFTESAGQPVIIVTQPAGAGTAAAMATKQAAADGYTLMLINIGSHAINPLLTSLPYDPVRDFQPITLLWNFPSVLGIPASLPARSVNDLVAIAKARPGGLNFASQGIGSGGHIMGEMFKAKTGAPMVHVPYKGAAPAVVDLVAGRADLLFASYASMSSHVKEGKLRMLALASPARIKALPDLSTLTELGVAGVDLDAWFGLGAPAGTPAAVVRRLNEEFVKAARSPDLVRQTGEQGIEISTGTPADFSSLMAADTARLAKLIKDARISAQ